MTSPKKPSAVLVYAGLLAGALVTLAPFVLGLLTSFTSAHQFATGTPLSWPRPPTLTNYANLGGAGFGRALAVTTLMTAVILLGQISSSVLAAYAFARLRFPGRDALFWVYLATLMVPGSVTVVPLYLMMAQLGLRNTFWALVLPFVFGSPYAIFLLRQHFRTIPTELDDAARVDGAGHLRIIRHVIVPMSWPAISAVMVITGQYIWNDFFWPNLYINTTTRMTAPLALYNLESTAGGGPIGAVFAGLSVLCVPCVIGFIFLQRRLMEGIGYRGISR